MLLALTSAARISEISFLDINYLVRHLSGYIFQCGRNKKASNDGKPWNPIRFKNFEENTSLCGCSHLDMCIDKTKDFRQEES